MGKLGMEEDAFAMFTTVPSISEELPTGLVAVVLAEVNVELLLGNDVDDAFDDESIGTGEEECAGTVNRSIGPLNPPMAQTFFCVQH